MAGTWPTHSLISRQFATSLVARVVERRLPHLSTATATRTSPRLPPRPVSAPPRDASYAAAAWDVSRVPLPLQAGRKFHLFTGKARATAGGEAGAGSGIKHKDREILVQHILLKDDQLQLLIELQRRISQEGLDLSDLAEENSICASKSEGGMLGWIKVGQTDPAFEEVAFNAPLNKLVRAKTKHGLHLLQVLNERKSQFLQQIQVEDFFERMQDPSFLEGAQLVDVREPDEVSTAAIKGFQVYSLSQFGQWAPRITEDLDPEVDTYVLCHHGMRSMQAANWLQSQGFSRLYNIAGGIHAYSTRVDKTIPTY